MTHIDTIDQQLNMIRADIMQGPDTHTQNSVQDPYARDLPWAVFGLAIGLFGTLAWIGFLAWVVISLWPVN